MRATTRNRAQYGRQRMFGLALLALVCLQHAMSVAAAADGEYPWPMLAAASAGSICTRVAYARMLTPCQNPVV
jgi:hypothetical protein